MELIYKNAYVAIIDAIREDANAGVHGLYPGQRRAESPLASFRTRDSLCSLLATRPDLREMLEGQGDLQEAGRIRSIFYLLFACTSPIARCFFSNAFVAAGGWKAGKSRFLSRIRILSVVAMPCRANWDTLTCS